MILCPSPRATFIPMCTRINNHFPKYPHNAMMHTNAHLPDFVSVAQSLLPVQLGPPAVLRAGRHAYRCA